jgi:hypothetical protein
MCESLVTAEQPLEQAASVVRDRRQTYGQPTAPSSTASARLRRNG